MILAHSLPAALADAKGSRQAHPKLQICEQNKDYFKPLNFGVVCYAAKENRYNEHLLTTSYVTGIMLNIIPTESHL